jgi:hypothetical protein
MAEIVNLRRARKAKAKADKDKAAEASRIAHGAPKVMRDLAKARAEKVAKDLEGHKKD